MLEGLPAFFAYVIGLSTEARSRPCGSLAVVLHHLLWDVVNAADVALHHYFPLTLDQPFLQSSSLGTPYQKWAKFIDEDFRKVDECMRRVVRAGFCAYEEITMVLADDHSKKDAWHWFHSAYTQYASCSVSGKRPC